MRRPRRRSGALSAALQLTLPCLHEEESDVGVVRVVVVWLPVDQCDVPHGLQQPVQRHARKEAAPMMTHAGEQDGGTNATHAALEMPALLTMLLNICTELNLQRVSGRRVTPARHLAAVPTANSSPSRLCSTNIAVVICSRWY